MGKMERVHAPWTWIREFTVKRVLLTLLGTAVLSFGIYNIHRQADITEGGVLGMVLLIHHWLGIPSSVVSPVLDVICYAVAFRYLGKAFIRFSLFSTLSLAGFFRLWEAFPPVLPDLSEYPLAAAVLGGLFVGVGVGIVVRQGGSSGGDDALALSISKCTHWRISRAYLFTDFTVLFLSLSYISVKRIAFSLITVTISSLLIDLIQKMRLSRQTGKAM